MNSIRSKYKVVGQIYPATTRLTIPMEASTTRGSLIGLCIQRKHDKTMTRRNAKGRSSPFNGNQQNGDVRLSPPPPMGLLLSKRPSFASWSMVDVVGVVHHHPVPCASALCMLFFMGVEYTLWMVPPTSPPVDLGFLLTQSFHSLLVARPILNSALAALNTVFVGMQAAYILSTLLVEGRPRPTIATLFMFTCRGILGCSTQLPVPQGFLGSGVDFPVGNVSFFLFFSGHVAGSVITSLDMRRMRRHRMASTFDTLNLLQGLRLLSSRGHYTIDLAVGVGAGYVFDILAATYVERNMNGGEYRKREPTCCSCGCSYNKQSIAIQKTAHEGVLH